MSGLLAATVVLAAVLWADELGGSKPPWQRLLSGEDAERAARLEKQIGELRQGQKWTQARKAAEELARLRAEKQGKDHWQAVDARWVAVELKRVEEAPAEKQRAYADSSKSWQQAIALEARGSYAAALPLRQQVLDVWRDILGEKHPDTAVGYNELARNQEAQGKHAQAEVGIRQALAICREVLGEEHPKTATCYNNLASNQVGQEKYAEAEVDYRQALGIVRKILGEEHPYLATSYDNLSHIQLAQGKYAEAEAGIQKALAINRKILGEDHPDTATCYNNLGRSQQAQAKYSEAEQSLHQALAIFRKVRGEEHLHTATGYANLARNQDAHGKYAQAEVSHRQALAIIRKVRGEEHRDTAACYNNLAENLALQGEYTQAEEAHRQALAIFRQVRGEEHRDTAIAYATRACTQQAQGKYAQAEEDSRQALAIFRKVLGEEHPLTAGCSNNLAYTQHLQGKYAEAEKGFRQALAICRKVHGEQHLDTAGCYRNLAFNQHFHGKYVEAEELATRAADVFAHTRLQIAAGGLDRATVTSQRSPLPLLAVLLARSGKPGQAWQRFEESLGRSTSDELSARLKRPAAERQCQTQLQARLRLLESQLEKLAVVSKLSEAQEEQRQQLLTQLLQTQNGLTKLNHELEEKYGPVAGKTLPVALLQKALPADGAYLGWLDYKGEAKAADPNGEHWAILLKPSGDPTWVRLPGTGPKNAWTSADDELPWKLTQGLTSAGEWQALALQLNAQRLAPLTEHLKGVRRLVVLPSSMMDGIPLEVITEGYTVSYASSASLFADQKQRPRPKTTGLVALGDPNFRQAEQPELPLPSGGVLLTVVLPRSPAALAGLKPGDVLLQLGSTLLNTPADLPKAMAAVDKSAAAKVWRLEGSKARELTLQVPAGKLGVLIASEPAPKALAAQRKSDALLTGRGSTTWQPLPGTRYEVSALKNLFADQKPTILLGSDASEAKLAELSSKGTLGQARFVHLATHGQARSDKPLASRIILSRDQGQSGELSAEQVLLGWSLDAELVTLSACQTGLGKQEGGEGFVGFAQALLVSGSRSVCLSRWNVNDLSTALLMERFYHNLLGKRAELKGPMGKAAALAEAKQWLRTLPRAEALKRGEAIGAGVERAPGAKELPRVGVPAGPADQPPYAHPFYWAGFVLVGDPD
jgi:hypothetical protein